MTDKTLRLILGNQLFPLEMQKIEDIETVFMCEDSGYSHMKNIINLKLLYFLMQ